mgnify:CR=1 FL=1
MKVLKVDCVKHADNFYKRFRGYMFTRMPSQREVMIFNHCNSIHTFNMKFNLDILFLNDENVVVKKVLSMPKRRWIKPVSGASKVVEAPEGMFNQVQEDEVVLFDSL